MKVTLVILTLLVATFVETMSQQVYFAGSDMPVFEESPAASTGLDNIYVIYDTDGVSMNFTQRSSGTSVTWYIYNELGGGYAEELSDVVRIDGTTTQLTQVIANRGYIIEEGTDRTYIWVVNYSDYMLELNGLSFDTESDCGSTTLLVDGSGAEMIYYSITGVQQQLDRELTLSYRTLEWNDSNMVWEEVTVEESEENFSSTLTVTAPYCDTEFTLSGDRFLRYWNMEEEVESDTYTTSAVAVESTAVQEERDVENEQESSDESTSLGGSAPVTITFTAYCTDAVSHNEWQMSYDQEFSDIENRFNQTEITMTFNEAGTFYYRFYGTDSSGDCEVTGETYTIFIGESSLECPNVFSPQGSEGVNDEWRVSYKSIVEFKCWIFNRWGVEVCRLNDPSQGWDGKYKGKYVKSGTYFYVIDALGSDGVRYKLKGDINILNYSGSSDSSSE